jgi:hypothetical protein
VDPQNFSCILSVVVVGGSMILTHTHQMNNQPDVNVPHGSVEASQPTSLFRLFLCSAVNSETQDV